MKNQIYSPPKKTDLIVKRVPLHSEDTFYDVCSRYIPSAVAQTKQLAKSYNWGSDPLTISKNIWSYFRNNFTYKLDKAGFEEIRLPSRIWHDKVFDCEDSTTFCSSLLINLNITHTIRMADYGDGWQHIYVKVGNITLDPVDSKFNHEDKGRFKDYLINPQYIKESKVWKSGKNMGLGRIGIDPQKARNEGKFIENGFTFERQNDKTVKKYMLRGRDCSISFTLDVEVKGYYALIPALLLQPSHIAGFENPLHFLPDAQPRNRAMSESGANVPILMAEKLRPAEISEGSTAYSGSPIINERGEVIQGNGRAFALRYYWEELQNDPKGYKKYLVENAGMFGFDRYPSKIYLKEKIRDDFDSSFIYVLGNRQTYGVMKPVLVRVVQCSDDEAIILGQYKQADLEAVTTKSNDVKSKVGLVSQKVQDDILRNVFPDDANETDTLSDLIRKSNVSSLLVRNKIFRSDEFTENYLSQRTGELNSDGVRLISELIVGLIFKGADTNTPELFRQLPDRVQTGIAKSAKYILGSDAKNDISSAVAKAIRGTDTYLQFKDLGNGFSSWVNQNTIFGKSPRDEYAKFELDLIKLFGDAKTQSEIVNYFKRLYYLTTDEKQEGLSFDNKPLHKAQNLATAITAVSDKKKAQTVEEQEQNYVNQLLIDLVQNRKYNKVSLEKLASTFGIDKSIHIKELTELAIVLRSRSIASKNKLSIQEKYKDIVALYYQQPISGLRTSDSILLQQYSTPSPLAYLMGLYCGLNQISKTPGVYYEPSAGNGILTIAAHNPSQFDVNELSSYRNSLLRRQGFNSVTQLDASIENRANHKKYKAVITNPPFGSLDEKIKFDGYAIGNLDQKMALLALQSMRDDGKAAIIIGGNTVWDKAGRIQGGKNRIFMSYLHQFYHVDDVINIDSKKLYSRQGTGFDVRIILVNGRKEVPEGYAPLFDPVSDKQVQDFETLYTRFEPFLKENSTDSDDKLIKAKALELKYKYQKIRLQNIEI